MATGTELWIGVGRRRKMESKLVTPEVGNDCWCVTGSIESHSYADESPRRPWHGRITNLRGLKEQRPIAIVSQVCEDGTVDTDSNATAIVTFDQLFARREDALAEYLRRCELQKERLLREIDNWNKECGWTEQELRSFFHQLRQTLKNSAG